MSLSDSYLLLTDDPMLQLKTKVININLPVNCEILQKSRSIYEYSWFVQRIRDYLKTGHGRDEALALAIKDCLGEGIMIDFIREHGSEVENMLFTEFNLEDALLIQSICEAIKESGMDCDSAYNWMEKHNKFARDVCQN